MSKMRPWCGRCVYWEADTTLPTATIGHCHRYPPGVAFNSKSAALVQKFPITDSNEWCGEWSGDETRLRSAAHDIAVEIAHTAIGDKAE